MKNKRGNVAVIVIIIVVVAIVAGAGGWFARKPQAPVQQTVVAQPAPVAKTQPTQSTTPATQPVAQNVVYNNANYSFQLTLPSDWKNYKTSFFENAIGGEDNPGGSLTFYLPTTDRSYVVNNGNNPSNVDENPALQGYGEAFILAIYSKNEWSRPDRAIYGKELITNGNYYIVFSEPNTKPSDFLDIKSVAYKMISGVANEQYLKNNIKFTK